MASAAATASASVPRVLVLIGSSPVRVRAFTDLVGVLGIELRHTQNNKGSSRGPDSASGAETRYAHDETKLTRL